MGQDIVNYLSNIVSDKNIKGKERELLLVLKSLDKENNNEVQVKINTLMEYMNTTNRTVLCKIINNLNEKGYLEIKRAGEYLRGLRLTIRYFVY